MGENKGIQQMEKDVSFLKKWWKYFTFYVIGSSLIALFIASCIFKFEIELQTMNNWASFILGIVATLVSVISLFLSFYNLEKANYINEKNMEAIQEFKDCVEDRLSLLQTSTDQIAASVQDGYLRRAKSIDFSKKKFE